jgi:predicted Fe-Mo cluster-binding NifX family protein
MYVSSRKFRIAIPTKGKEGLKDVVSEVFGRSNTFTIVDVEEGEIKNVKVLENPAVSYKHGAGPVVVKMLMDCGVNVAFSAEFGPGVSTLLDQHSVTRVTVPAGTIVSESTKNALPKVRK